MNEQKLTLEQKLELLYYITKQVNLKYDEHALLQQYYQELKEGLVKEVQKEKVEDSPI